MAWVDIAAGSAVSVELERGRSCRVVNTLGGQVVDTWAFAARDYDEYLSMEHSRSANYKLLFEPGIAFHLGEENRFRSWVLLLSSGRLHQVTSCIARAFRRKRIFPCPAPVPRSSGMPSVCRPVSRRSSPGWRCWKRAVLARPRSSSAPGVPGDLRVSARSGGRPRSRRPGYARALSGPRKASEKDFLIVPFLCGALMSPARFGCLLLSVQGGVK